jgi:NAD(P)H-hydrate epimerase
MKRRWTAESRSCAAAATTAATVSCWRETLLQRGIDTAVFVVGALSDIRGDARTNLDILGRLGVTVVEINDEHTWELHFSEISKCSLIVDAIFGTGLHSPLAA